MILRGGFTLGRWTVYPLEGRLEDDDDSRRIQPKSMDVLLCLAEASGEVVERDEILRQVWGERAVSDEPLTRCVGELRRALGDARGEPGYIQTIPKRGYRLLKPVQPLSQPEPEQEPVGPPLTFAQKALRVATLKKLAAGLVILVLAAIVQVGVDRMLDEPSRAGSVNRALPGNLQRSIAVLPFADMSVSGDQSYMSDGIAEELLNLLAKVRALRVISRSSSFSFKDKAVDVRTIADQLGVAYVVEGSVRTSGNRIRITAQLIDARTDAHVWAEAYDRELKDVFAIQDEIALAIVNKLELTLLSDPPRSRTTDPEAYALFLQARYLHEQPAGDSFVRAFDFYKAALAIDDSYVPAWVWLAALYDDTVNSSGLPYDEVRRLAFDAIDRALEIDPDDPLALGMSGILLDAWENDSARAAAQMQRGLELDPGNPILLRWAAILLTSIGRHDEAVRVAEYLFARDPVGNISKVNLAATYLMAGRFDDAIRVCAIQLAVIADSGPCRSQLIQAYLYAGQAEAALELLERTDGSRIYTRLAPMVFYGAGQQSDFEAALAGLRKSYEDGDKGLAYWLARTHIYTGDIDAAFDWFARAQRDGTLKISPSAVYFADAHDDPRWDALLESIGRSMDKLQAIELNVAVPAI